MAVLNKNIDIIKLLLSQDRINKDILDEIITNNSMKFINTIHDFPISFGGNLLI